MVIATANGTPSRGWIEANARALARYAALCQQGERYLLLSLATASYKIIWYDYIFEGSVIRNSSSLWTIALR